MNRIERRVNNDATIRIDNISYDVPMKFIKQKVEVRYLPDDMDNAFIFYENDKYNIRTTNGIHRTFFLSMSSPNKSIVSKIHAGLLFSNK
jgi:hypothetical protein